MKILEKVKKDMNEHQQCMLFINNTTCNMKKNNKTEQLRKNHTKSNPQCTGWTFFCQSHLLMKSPI